MPPPVSPAILPVTETPLKSWVQGPTLTNIPPPSVAVLPLKVPPLMVTLAVPVSRPPPVVELVPVVRALLFWMVTLSRIAVVHRKLPVLIPPPLALTPIPWAVLPEISESLIYTSFVKTQALLLDPGSAPGCLRHGGKHHNDQQSKTRHDPPAHGTSNIGFAETDVEGCAVDDHEVGCGERRPRWDGIALLPLRLQYVTWPALAEERDGAGLG